MNVIPAENYEDLCIAFQTQLTKIVRDTLSEHGISSEKAEAICGDVVFDISMLFDQDSLDNEGTTYRAVLGFTDDADVDTPSLLLDDNALNMHEYAFGIVEAVFENREFI